MQLFFKNNDTKEVISITDVKFSHVYQKYFVHFESPFSKTNTLNSSDFFSKYEEVHRLDSIHDTSKIRELKVLLRMLHLNYCQDNNIPLDFVDLDKIIELRSKPYFPSLKKDMDLFLKENMATNTEISLYEKELINKYENLN